MSEQPLTDKTALRRALRIVDDSSNSDFLRYKPDLLMRRFQERVNGRDPEQYLVELTSSEDEQLALKRSFSVGVTGFFRDPSFYSELENKWISELLGRFDAPLRVWVPGCSSGEEVYSLAMVLAEALRPAQEFHIFATDIDARALDVGATACYTALEVGFVAPERIDAHFELLDESETAPDPNERVFRVRRELRQRVTFSHHDLLTEAPLGGIHLLSCRNVLIYLQEVAQREVIRNAQAALVSGGVLALGPSEFLRWPEGFQVVDRDNRLFERMSTGSSPTAADTHVLPEQIVERYVPRGFLVAEDGQLIRCFGGAERYLRIKRRRPTNNLFDLMPAELTTSMAKAMKDATWDLEKVQLDRIEFATESGSTITFDVSIEPVGLGGEPSLGNNFFIAFEPSRARHKRQAQREGSSSAKPKHLSGENARKLRQRLAAARRHRQDLSDQLVRTRQTLADEQQRREFAEQEIATLNDAIKRLQDD